MKYSDSSNTYTACSTKSVGFYVDIDVDEFESKDETCRIWTRQFDKISSENCDYKSNTDDTPLVLIHGMGAGGAFFSLNVDGLAKFSTVYLIDLPGNTIYPYIIQQVISRKVLIECKCHIICF